MVNPYAGFDCLSVADRLGKWLGDVSGAELHLFSYLACLLSLYRSRPVAEWGYDYVCTKLGAPFGPAIDDAVTELHLAGLLDSSDQYLRLTSLGREEYEALRSLGLNARRELYLEGACASVLALPRGLVREALMQEPELSRSRKVPATRTLLEDGPGLASLYDQFLVLSEAIGIDVDDLMVPSVIWLTYLARISMSDEVSTGVIDDKA